ncbi:MAG: exodeoxyribonuclease VII large subunit [Clostridia bacterium]|nr:exodeoxyribonuclease VII large subunit [Clostridia bacterium]MBR3779673.1 exodeoxyribonuclease VII large subunit [Clostridia bacterium]
MPDGVVLSVSQLNRYVKSIIEQDRNLQTVFVQGEISNFTNHYKTGHFYMTIKDEFSSIKAVMFKTANMHLKFMPENAMSVIIKGRVSVFERDGQYQLYIDDMQPDGIGALSYAFEQLKERLAKEGLFDTEKKKTIPAYPQRVGVVTSPTGAAIRDIINVISRRFPMTELILCPVAVQGDYAAPQIKAAIEEFNKQKAADVLIVGRGGGSIEELWAFNEEIVARAVAASDIPVISAVGHETDFTICDFAADLRAPTPSAAAELAVPDMYQQKEMLGNMKRRLDSAVSDKIGVERARLEIKKSVLQRMSPQNYIDNLRVRCDRASMAMENAVKQSVTVKSKEFSAICAKLDAMSPLKILARGYSVATKEGRIITDVSDVRKGDMINVRVSNGEIECEVKGC